MKIALSASYWRVPAVQKVLHTCDTIYTTNWDALNELRETFGDHKINLLPHGHQWVISAIVENLKDAYGDTLEVVTFGDIVYLKKRALVVGDWETHMLLLKDNGFDIVDNRWRKDNRWLGEAPEGIVPEEVKEYCKRYM